MKSLKKLIAIIALLIFTFNMVGFWLVFTIQQYHIVKTIKAQIKQGISNQKLVTIVFNHENQHEFDFEYEREFKYKGTMYDVVNMTNLDENTIIYQCIADTKETALLINFENATKQQNSPISTTNHSLHLLVKLFSNIYCNTPTNIAFSDALLVNKLNYFYSQFYKAPTPIVEAPPPEFHFNF